MAPIAVGALILWVDWRQIFLPVAIISLCIGMAYFWFRDRIRDSSGQPTSRRGKLVYSAGSYLRVLRNRNMVLIALVMMVGGAGRGVVTPTYLPLHLNLDLDLETSLAIFSLAVLQVGGIAGSLGMGWLSDRVSRKKVIQASQLLSVVATGWLAWQGPYLPILTLSLLVYGAFTQARGVLTQALVADSVGEADRDAAFSVYFFLSFVSTPFWAVLTGYLMETYSFSWAFSLLGLTYLLGAFFMLFVQENRQAARAA